MVRLVVALGLLGPAGLLTACGDDVATPGATSGSTIPVGDLTVRPGELVWAVGSTVHVGDRSEDVGRRIDQFVVGPHGIYYVSHGSLWFTDLDREKRVVERLRFTSPVLSPDGRYIGFLDFSTAPASTVVYDLETGRETVRDDSGMGDAKDDLADLYEDAEPFFLGFDHEAAYSQGVDDSVFRIPLDGSDVTVERRGTGSGRVPAAVLPPPGQGRQIRTGLGGEISPDGTVALRNLLNLRFRPVARTGDGGPLDVALGGDRNRFAIAGWLDDHRVWGAAGRARGAVSLGRSATLVACDLRPGGRCEDLSDPIPLDDHQTVMFDGRWLGF